MKKLVRNFSQILTPQENRIIMEMVYKSVADEDNVVDNQNLIYCMVYPTVVDQTAADQKEYLDIFAQSMLKIQSLLNKSIKGVFGGDELPTEESIEDALVMTKALAKVGKHLDAFIAAYESEKNIKEQKEKRELVQAEREAADIAAHSESE